METLKNETELIEKTQTYLTLPERALLDNPHPNLGQELGSFLIEKNFIEGLDTKENGWEFEYDFENKKILIPEEKISSEEWKSFFFRKQTVLSDDESYSLFPMYPLYTEQKDEIEKYCFLQSVVQAYQENLDKRILDFKNFFDFCLEKREEGKHLKGLTSFGNTKPHKISGALKDANELVTMYIWHPKYFETYAEYLIKNRESFGKNKLVKISQEESENLKNFVQIYVENMKEEINF